MLGPCRTVSWTALYLSVIAFVRTKETRPFLRSRRSPRLLILSIHRPCTSPGPTHSLGITRCGRAPDLDERSGHDARLLPDGESVADQPFSRAARPLGPSNSRRSAYPLRALCSRLGAHRNALVAARSGRGHDSPDHSHGGQESRPQAAPREHDRRVRRRGPGPRPHLFTPVGGRLFQAGSIAGDSENAALARLDTASPMSGGLVRVALALFASDSAGYGPDNFVERWRATGRKRSWRSPVRVARALMVDRPDSCR